MIETLSASTGLLASDPVFWMPLALFGIVIFLLAGQIVLDGFDVGCGLLLPWLEPVMRSRVLDSLTPWRGANESWLLLLFVVFMAAFPLGWAPVLGELYLPIMLLVSGSVLRSLSFEFRARAPMAQQSWWMAVFSVGAYCSAAGLGLWLAESVSVLSYGAGFWLFAALVLLAVGSNCILLAACWILTWDAGALRLKAARWARATIRWVAAGMVAVSLILALTNPAIFYRWTNSANLHVGAVWWLLMLCGFVYVEHRVRAVVRNPAAQVWRMPLVVTAALNWFMLIGLVYSFFPFLVLDNLTVWDAAASRESLRWVMAGVVVVAPVLLVFNVLGYWRLFRYKPKLQSA